MEQLETITWQEHEREQILAKVYRKLGLHEKLRERWRNIQYKEPIPEQLKLNL